jgi:hypothetical protein
VEEVAAPHANKKMINVSRASFAFRRAAVVAAFSGLPARP